MAKEAVLMLIEDRAEDAEMATIALEKSDLVKKVHWINDGEAALDFLFSNKMSEESGNGLPDLILLDINLGRSNGLDILKAIKSNPLTRKIPVVILTTSKTSQELAKAYDLGANSFVVKPVQFEKFTEVIDCIGNYWLSVNNSPTTATTI